MVIWTLWWCFFTSLAGCLCRRQWQEVWNKISRLITHTHGHTNLIIETSELQVTGWTNCSWVHWNKSFPLFAFCVLGHSAVLTIYLSSYLSFFLPWPCFLSAPHINPIILCCCRFRTRNDDGLIWPVKDQRCNWTQTYVHQFWKSVSVSRRKYLVILKILVSQTVFTTHMGKSCCSQVTDCNLLSCLTKLMLQYRKVNVEDFELLFE